LIDGIGDRTFLPIGSWSKFIGTQTIRRRLTTAWKRFEDFQRRGAPGKAMNSPAMTWQQGCLLHRS
jgi:hypothetical protein